MNNSKISALEIGFVLLFLISLIIYGNMISKEYEKRLRDIKYDYVETYKEVIKLSDKNDDMFLEHFETLSGDEYYDSDWFIEAFPDYIRDY